MHSRISTQCQVLRSTDQLTAVVDVGEGDAMLEVGLGTGSLTNVLINAGAFVLAIKKDPYMATHVSERFVETDRLKVLKEDFVKCRIHSRVVVVGMYRAIGVGLNCTFHNTRKKERLIHGDCNLWENPSLPQPCLQHQTRFSPFFSILSLFSDFGFPSKSLISSSINMNCQGSTLEKVIWVEVVKMGICSIMYITFDSEYMQSASQLKRSRMVYSATSA